MGWLEDNGEAKKQKMLIYCSWIVWGKWSVGKIYAGIIICHFLFYCRRRRCCFRHALKIDLDFFIFAGWLLTFLRICINLLWWGEDNFVVDFFKARYGNFMSRTYEILPGIFLFVDLHEKLFLYISWKFQIFLTFVINESLRWFNLHKKWIFIFILFAKSHETLILI
jgi:hypothetical protein